MQIETLPKVVEAMTPEQRQHFVAGKLQVLNEFAVQMKAAPLYDANGARYLILTRDQLHDAILNVCNELMEG